MSFCSDSHLPKAIRCVFSRRWSVIFAMGVSLIYTDRPGKYNDSSMRNGTNPRPRKDFFIPSETSIIRFGLVIMFFLIDFLHLVLEDSRKQKCKQPKNTGDLGSRYLLSTGLHIYLCTGLPVCLSIDLSMYHSFYSGEILNTNTWDMVTIIYIQN